MMGRLPDGGHRVDTVRLGIIGCGGMARNHIAAFDKIPRLQFTAACDAVPDQAEQITQEHGVQTFPTAEAMFDAQVIDAVLIATPHYFHPPLAIAAMQRGLHVLTEKPVAVTAKAAAEVNAVYAQHPQLVYAVMHQMRSVPMWQKMKQMIAGDEIGPIQRVLVLATHWFRTQAYYDSGGWRATWAGEGGGVLLNQCPHQIDMMWWLLGSPNRLHAHMAFGKYHDIEVEDEVTVYLEYLNGATGVFVASTGETPGRDMFEVSGDRGRLSVIDGDLQCDQLDQSAGAFCRQSPESVAAPEITHHDIETPKGGGNQAMLANFVDAILDGADLLAPGNEGLHSVEMINAMITSGLRQRPVNVPVDPDEYEQLLEDLKRQNSKLEIQNSK